jgi:YggT family protein
LEILCLAINVYFLALFARIILSWFPVRPGTTLAQVFSFLYSITEPVLGPVRRMIPPIGMGIDISPIIVIFGIQILAGILLDCRLGL